MLSSKLSQIQMCMVFMNQEWRPNCKIIQLNTFDFITYWRIKAINLIASDDVDVRLESDVEKVWTKLKVEKRALEKQTDKNI